MESGSGCDTALGRDLGAQGVTGVLVAPEHGGSGLGLLEATVGSIRPALLMRNPDLRDCSAPAL